MISSVVINVFYFSIVLGLSSGVGLVTFNLFSKNKKYNLKHKCNYLKKRNEYKHKRELEEYNKEIKNYADYIRKLKLTDLEIAIKLIYDMWQKIGGYMKNLPNDSLDYEGVNRLYLYKHNYGVCRHFVDDMVHRLNEINPKYNARMVSLEFNGTNSAYTLPIKRRFYFDDDKTKNDKDKAKDKTKDIINVVGNHAVCLMDLSNGVTLMIDPTNLNIGYIKNKNINYFDSKTKYKINKLGSFILDGNKLSKTLKNNLELPFRSLMTYECLNERYGPLMQENALNHIKYIDKHLSDIGGKQL